MWVSIESSRRSGVSCSSLHLPHPIPVNTNRAENHQMRGLGAPSTRRRKLRIPSRTRLLRLLPVLIILALIPPIFFHFRLRRFHQMRQRKCGWIESPPLVCAHGGDSSKAAPNTMDAYRIALQSHVDCIEIDVSRSSDGVLLALHDRAGICRGCQIKKLDAGFHLAQEFHNQKVPTLEDALSLILSTVRLVILDAKVGPPSHERGLARDILSVIERTHCENCLIWAKSDIVGRDVIKLRPDIAVGYIVMNDPSTGKKSNLLRMNGAKVVGVYHPLVDETLVKTLHRRGKEVYAWTVDDSDSMRRMLSERVDGIVTGKPSVLQSLMQNMRTECFEDGFRLR